MPEIFIFSWGLAAIMLVITIILKGLGPDKTLLTRGNLLEAQLENDKRKRELDRQEDFYSAVDYYSVQRTYETEAKLEKLYREYSAYADAIERSQLVKWDDSLIVTLYAHTHKEVKA